MFSIACVHKTFGGLSLKSCLSDLPCCRLETTVVAWLGDLFELHLSYFHRTYVVQAQSFLSYVGGENVSFCEECLLGGSSIDPCKNHPSE